MAATTRTNINDPTEDVPFRVQDRRRTRFFTIDNELFDRFGWLLGPYGLSVYMALARFANQESECFPSQSTIAKRTGMSRMQANREIEKLKQLKLINVRHQFGANGQKRSNLYLLLDLPHVPERDNPCNTALQPHVTDSDNPCNSELQQNKTHIKKTHEEQDKQEHKRRSNKQEPVVLNEVYQGSSKRDLPEQDIQEQEPQQDTDREPSGRGSPLGPSPLRGAGSPDKAVVVALIDLGISEKIAEFLSGQHTPEKITEKMDYLAFLTEQQPERVKNPCGWLRTAIIDDYGKPDGFIPKVEQEQLAAEEEEQAQEETVQVQEIENQRQSFQERLQAEHEAAIMELRQQHGTTEEDINFWDEAQREIKCTMTKDMVSLIAGAHILKVRNESVVIGVERKVDWWQLQHPGTQIVVKRALAYVAGRDVSLDVREV